MNGRWHFGENSVEKNNTDPGMVISGNNGNIISDTGSRYSVDPAMGEMVFSDFPTYAHGNNHGGMAKVNDTWYFFGHRHSGPQLLPPGHRGRDLAVQGRRRADHRADGITSSGVAGSMSAYAPIDANHACYILEAADHPAPAIEKNNPHSDCMENTPYIAANRNEAANTPHPS